MSTFTATTRHPLTKKCERARWFDDYFGQHNYGVEFADGYVADPRTEECEIVEDLDIDDYWE